MGERSIPEPADGGGRVAPVPPAERVETLDVVRGVAILGILPVNALAFKASLYAPLVHTDAAAVDRASRWLTAVLFQQKFYTLFAFLFGLGLAIQEERATARGADAGRLWKRRLLALAAIGAAHAFGLWWGDILLTYAALGSVLFAFRRARVRTIAIAAVAIGLAPWALQVAILAGVGALLAFAPQAAEALDAFVAATRADMVEHVRSSVEVYSGSDLAAIAARRAADVGRLYASALPAFPYIAGLMLAGYASGRAGLHRRLDDLGPAMRRALPWLAAVGLAGNVAYGTFVTFGDPLVPSLAAAGAMAAGTVAIPALSAAYAVAVALAWGTAAGRRTLAPVAAVGRTALSAYLLQSAVATTVLYGYGFGLYGRLGPAASWALVAPLWLALPPLASAWLRRFRYGPAEWLWRGLAYGRFPALRR